MKHRFGLPLLLSILFLGLAGQQPALGTTALRPSASTSQTTPELIENAYRTGAINADERLRYLAYALYDGQALPRQFLSTRGWYGTAQALEVDRQLFRATAERRQRFSPTVQREIDRLAARAATVCTTEDGAHTATSVHFLLNYTAIGGGLTASDYLVALEDVFTIQIEQFGWAQPPLEPTNPYGKYPVQAAPLPTGLLGMVTYSGGDYTGFIGDNPHTPATESQAAASCMVINSDLSHFGDAQHFLEETAAHELVHAVQFGYGDPNGFEDRLWYESTAMATQHDITGTSTTYDYLWPTFEACLGQGTGRVYANWIFFHYAAEHNDGEDLLQRFMVNVSAGQEALPAYNAALSHTGNSLPETYHDYAIATKFNKACTDSASPHCYTDGPAYTAAVGNPTSHAALSSVGGRHDGALQDHYALNWIDLPSSGSYGLRFKNLSPGGLFRVSIVADMGDSLHITPFPTLIAAQRSAQILSYGVPAGALSVVAVITNQQQLSGNPSSCTASSYEFQTFTAVTGEPEPPRQFMLPLLGR